MKSWYFSGTVDKSGGDREESKWEVNTARKRKWYTCKPGSLAAQRKAAASIRETEGAEGGVDESRDRCSVTEGVSELVGEVSGAGESHRVNGVVNVSV